MKIRAPKSPRLRLWPVRRDDSSRVLVGAAGRSRSDWRRRTIGAVIGQSACRLLACACEQQSIARAQGLAAACKAATTCAMWTNFLTGEFTLYLTWPQMCVLCMERVHSSCWILEKKGVGEVESVHSPVQLVNAVPF